MENEIALNDDKNEQPKITGWKKWMLILISIISGIYVFFPEYTDFIPFLGWLDEGIAILILTYSLNKLGIKIPIINRLIQKKMKKQSKDQV